MTRVYYKEARAAFIVFDLTRVATFEGISKWKRDIDKKLQSKIPVVLLANKCDLRGKRIVEDEDIERMCKTEGIARACDSDN